MSQYAAANHKPIIGYTNEDLYSFNDTEDLLQTKKKGVLVKTNLDDFHLCLNQLINSKEVRLKNIETTKDCVITPEDFTKLLFKNITHPQPINPKITENIKINLNSIFELYVDMETNFLNVHYIHIWKVLKWTAFSDNFGIGLTSFFHKVKSFVKFRIKHFLNK